ncbi:tetratricopeptide repeat protein [Flavobacterium sp. SUN046]|uniref:tetratricopeptide repeat protein n=1 Tax=Flavobacterium sp. SUN046 TaxID=3002440 RepID=UPI002DBF8FF7|nr:tetratricopeptide repeat protein [Flavobacterium sp. SUN046]MEC4049024.1 tetratricopeptide repeat protein [Flavobacterium sp. SUN046]
MKLIKLFSSLLILFSCSLFSQRNSDTLDQVKVLIKNKQYSQAEALLENYYPSHKEDLATNWMYAQVLHWNYKNKLSNDLFEKAIALAPKNTAIQLDYARMLYEIGEFKKAQTLINTLKTVEATQAEALLMEANIHFWSGHINEAQEIIQELKKLYPNTYITDEIVKNIDEATSPYLKTNFEYQSDNQPMKFVAEKIELGQYRSWLLSPKLEIANYNFTPTQQALTAKVSNQLYLASIGFSATIAAGAYKNFSGTTDWIGGIELSQKVNKHTSLKLGYNKRPYLGTLVSTTLNLTQNNLFGELDYTNNKLFSIHAGYNNQYFNDKNNIATISSWIISKPFSLSKLKVQLGYGYSYSNAKNNLFTAKESLNDAITSFSPNITIEGYYNPYFTPKEQMVNSVLLILNYKASNKVEFGAKGTYGFAAQCLNPYIYLDNDGAGNTILTTNYFKTNFNPYEVNAFMGYKLTSSIEAKFTYTNQQTFFYNRNNFNLGLNFKL